MIEGSVNQISIPVDNFEQAKEFYEKVFRWEVDIQKYPNYAIVNWENSMSLGFYKSKNIVTGGPMLVFSVNNIDDTCEKIKEAGGEIVQQKHAMSDGNYGIVFKNVFGNRFRASGKSLTSL
ncbi:MAG: VOC family protein [Candidatus Heimdallarchaeota archaeon]